MAKVVDEDVRRCPDHSEPGASVLEQWACPDECPHFLAELGRRLHDAKVNGNYVEMRMRGKGRLYTREFANHVAIGPWKLRRFTFYRDSASLMHGAYRRKRRGRW